MKTFADKVKEARETLGMSQGVLAEKVDVSQRSITAYETGASSPRGTTARKLAHALNISLDYLLNDENRRPQKRPSKKTPTLPLSTIPMVGAGKRKPKYYWKKTGRSLPVGALSQDAKDAFFEAVMTAYVDPAKKRPAKPMGHKNRQQ